MGLDNSVQVRINLDKMGFSYLPTKLFNLAEDIYYVDGMSNPFAEEENKVRTLVVDLCYWRKWWGVRNMAVRSFHPFDNDLTYRSLTGNDIDAIIEALNYFDNEDIWENEGDSIWEYSEDGIHSQIEVDIFVLIEFKNLLANDKDLQKLFDEGVAKLVFVDSY